MVAIIKMSSIPKIIVIVGETASGKSSLALQLAQRFNGEIICADSSTVRRQASIGTAKPTADEQALVTHHLVDIVDPDQDFSAAKFQQLAKAAITDVCGRGKLPIVVGGTGLYIDALLYDYSFLPSVSQESREELNSLGLEQLLDLIERKGYELGTIDTRNQRRLIRFIETGGVQPTKQLLRANTLVLGLETERAVLHQRIAERVDAMLEQGLEQEVKALADSYGWGCEALKAVGYSQWQNYFSGDKTLEETRQNIVKATRDLAKRQRTWFKRNKSIQWLITPVNWSDTVDLVTTSLEK